MSLRTAVPAACLLAILPANAQGWGTFYAAYEDGLAAQARGDHRTALQAFQAAAAKRPEPGARVKTYGLNFLNAYHPHLRAAECALALGDLEAADRALQASARFNAEPASTREALAQRLARAREAARPKDAPPAPRPEDPRPAPRPVEPAPVEPRTAPAPRCPPCVPRRPSRDLRSRAPRPRNRSPPASSPPLPRPPPSPRPP
jgi:hypothetical protein